MRIVREKDILLHSDEFSHYGVKGMKWGKRKQYYGRSEKDTIIEKGTTLGRVARTRDDKTYDNKKYVSTNKKDHKKWEKYFGKSYGEYGEKTYNIEYRAVKDLKVASIYSVGKTAADMINNDPKFRKLYISDLTSLDVQKWGVRNVYDPAEMVTTSMARQTKLGKMFVNNMLKKGYDAVADVHGYNVAEDPIIILNPDKKLENIRQYETKYTRKYL